MPETLLRTKLFVPPLRPNLVRRPGLIEQLNQGLQLGHKLTLIAAPASFGKTTLASEWVAGCERPTAWLSLDEGDNDRTRFLTYLVAALQTLALSEVEGFAPNIGEGALAALQSPQPPPSESILTTLLNEIATVADNFILVLDDYHIIESSPVDDALTFTLEHLPQQMHLVIATRNDPNLPLARLRGRGQLSELRAWDLRFTSSEAAEFLNQTMGLDLSEEEIAALENRTEGWIAGLQLAAISMRGREDSASRIKSFSGSHRFVLDYLIEEVLEQQSESVENFLLQTAVLDQLTGPLCDAVRFGETLSSSDGNALSGQATLEMLEHANLFIIPLDVERRWYRYHHLFADLLRQRLHQTRPQQVVMLHQRASDWYEQNGFDDKAIDHALWANDFERAANLIEKHVDALWRQGKHIRLRSWLAKLPDELIFSRPLLSIYHAWYLFAGGNEDTAERVLQAAEQIIEPGTDRAAETLPPERKDRLSDTDRTRLIGKAAAIRAFMDSYREDVPGIILHARQALEYLPEQDLPMRSIAAIALGDAYAIKGDMAASYQARLEATEVSRSTDNTYYLIAANLKLAMTLRTLGQLHRTVEVCQQQLQLAETSGMSHGSLVGLLFAIWGEVLAELNDLDGAMHRVQRGVELTERGGDLAMLGWSYHCLMRVLFSRGDATGAEKVVQKMETIARESAVPLWFTNYVAAWQTRFWLAQGKLEAASQWVEQRGLEPHGASKLLQELDYIKLIELVVLARVLFAQKRPDEAARLLTPLLKASEAGGHTSRVIEILLLQALAFQAGGEPTRALDKLQRALTLAEPGGFVRIFVDEAYGQPMAHLLYEALSRGIAPDYVRRLLAAFPVADPEQTGPSKTKSEIRDPRKRSGEIVEPLSEREMEVLELIAEGLSNPEIASRLFLALNTVKAHTRNIYGKLDVHNRTQAVARARTLGLLPTSIQ